MKIEHPNSENNFTLNANGVIKGSQNGGAWRWGWWWEYISNTDDDSTSMLHHSVSQTCKFFL